MTALRAWYRALYVAALASRVAVLGAQEVPQANVGEVERVVGIELRARYGPEARLGLASLRGMTLDWKPEGAQRTAGELAVLQEALGARVVDLPYRAPGCGKPGAPQDCITLLVHINPPMIEGDSAMVKVTIANIAGSTGVDREYVLRRQGSAWVVVRNEVVRHFSFVPGELGYTLNLNHRHLVKD